MPRTLEDTTTLGLAPETSGDSSSHTIWLVHKAELSEQLNALSPPPPPALRGVAERLSEALFRFKAARSRFEWGADGALLARYHHGKRGQLELSLHDGPTTLLTCQLVDPSGKLIQADKFPVTGGVLDNLARWIIEQGWSEAPSQWLPLQRPDTSGASQALKVFSDGDRGAFDGASKTIKQAGPGILPRVLETLKACRDIEARAYLESLALSLSDQRTSLIVEHFLDASAPVSYRVSLARVLGSSRHSRALAPMALRDGLKDADREVRAVSAEALGTLGRADPRIIDDLHSALQDEDPFVRDCARESLEELGVS